ncbi:5-methyltetrahydropteroyltriglutamate--homocysteine S-methyltransferase [Brenneria tiliae]|uniref:5-methyltetrahydropteroyltriglutamate--homocysteine S-methyltransferase n=1 Tax=Brenneria tiliae TaxID=2914984 RepID=A0ABT0N129_9GAMM|nr:5-methyltetrahydropteroyltriglutamate--homocysteine S-methyltransferase [Brenneria tiliae]MCL2895800.1 5-methyltetrahydropteroyltriglutamate--homocysteine S-methyltransferase [Brenneria tiliae]
MQDIAFRADVVGSFLRPAALKQARADFQAGKISESELRHIEDEAIIDLVAKQKAAGLKAVTDGEFRRSMWHSDFFWGFDGIERKSSDYRVKFNEVTTKFDTSRIVGKIRFTSHPFIDHFTFLKSVAGDDVIARQTIPSPSQCYWEFFRPDNLQETLQQYPDLTELQKDIVQAYRDVVRAFYAAGCRHLQFDDCTWGFLVDPKKFNEMKGLDIDFDTVAQLYLDINNQVLADKPADMVINTHICRGNYSSDWWTSGGYEPVAPYVLNKENVDAFYLEYDTDRAGGFQPLEKVGEGKTVVLGLVTSKSPVLEDKEQLKARISEASKFVPLKHLCLSPQCGFASNEEGNTLTEEEQWAKIRLIVEVANEVWGE